MIRYHEFTVAKYAEEEEKYLTGHFDLSLFKHYFKHYLQFLEAEFKIKLVPEFDTGILKTKKPVKGFFGSTDDEKNLIDKFPSFWEWHLIVVPVAEFKKLSWEVQSVGTPSVNRDNTTRLFSEYKGKKLQMQFQWKAKGDKAIYDLDTYRSIGFTVRTDVHNSSHVYNLLSKKEADRIYTDIVKSLTS